MRPFFIVTLLLLFFSDAFAVDGFFKPGDVLKGEIVSRTDKTPLFKYTRTVLKGGDDTIAKRHYEYMDGKPAATETVTYHGGRVTKMVWEQFQSNESGQFELADGKIKFSYTIDGKTKTDEEKLVEPFVSQDEVIEYVYKNWDLLMNGKTISIRLPVIFRMETVGFKFFKDGETDDGIIIKMKPSSFIIAALVKPLIFILKKDGDHRTISVDGRVTPKTQVGGKWKDLDALFVIKY